MGATAWIPAGPPRLRHQDGSAEGIRAQAGKGIGGSLPEGEARARAPEQGLEALRQRQGGGGVVIPRDFITEWRAEAPWVQDFQVEQDLVISRALVAIFIAASAGRGARVPGRDGTLQAPPEARCPLFGRHRPRPDAARA